MTVTFFVAGEPTPQGSMRAFMLGKGPTARPILTSDNRRLKDWRSRVAVEAQLARMQHRCPTFVGPVTIALVFKLHRPISLPRRVVRCAKKPDLDKLVRAVFDGITGVLVEDDSRIDALTARKEYARPGEPVGVEVTIDTDFVALPVEAAFAFEEMDV